MIQEQLAPTGGEAEGLGRALPTDDVAVMIRTPDIDQMVEPAPELVHEIRAVRTEVRVPTVRADHDAVLVVAVVGGAEPRRAVGLVDLAGHAQPVDRLADLATFVE